MTRRLLLVPILALLVSAGSGCSPAHAATPSPMLPVIEYLTTQSLTQAAPTSSTDGMDLSHVLAYRLSVCGIGGNLQATGSLKVYVYSDTQAAATGGNGWMHNSDQDKSIANNGEACQLWSDLPSSIHKGRVKYVSTGTTLSAGTQVSVLVQAVVQ